MPVLSVHRDDHLWTNQIMHRLKIRPVGMTRDMIEPGVIIDHINALFGKLVDDANNTSLIAGNGFRRE